MPTKGGEKGDQEMNKILKSLVYIVVICFCWSNIIIVCFAEIKESSEATTSEKVYISAESRIRGLAIKNENNRKISSFIVGGSGLLLITLGLFLTSNNQNYDDSTSSLSLFSIIEGFACMISGAVLYFIPTGVENDYISIQKVDDGSEKGRIERNLLAENSLKNGAEKAHNERLWGCGLSWGAGLLYVGMGDSYSAVGVLFLGIGLYSWFNKSEIEREYEQYLGDKELISKQLKTTITSLEGTFILLGQ